MANIEFGYIYVASNEAFKDGIYKIGYTGGKVEDRLNQLYSTNVPMPFKEEFSMFVPFPKEIEEGLHYELSGYRYNDSREFFKCTMNDVCDKLHVVNKYWKDILDILAHFFYVGGVCLSDEEIQERYIVPLFSGHSLEEELQKNERLYIKGDKVYYSEVCVEIGDIEAVKNAIEKVKKH